MNIPNYARYDYCLKKACEFLDQYSIQSFPVDPFEIIKKEKYGLMKYSELADEYSCSIDKVCTCLRSSDGETILENDCYSIAYNDSKPITRIRFTLMHELGHIYLNHLVDFEKTVILRNDKITSSLTKPECRVLENEANAFARNVLSPVSMFLTLKNKSVSNVAYTFGLSVAAAETRIDLIDTDARLITGLNLSQKMMLVYRRFMNKRRCIVCNVQFFKTYDYCPICGSKNTLKWGDGNMIYPKSETYENGKLTICPNCQNEETDIEGDFCQICGKSLINRCSSYDCSNQAPLPSNARYCPECGSYSTFYNAGFLKEWDYNETANGFIEIPDSIIDEELPIQIDEELPFF